jgi:hypothetical protein
MGALWEWHGMFELAFIWPHVTGGSPSRWLRVLSRGFAAARLLGLRIRIPPEAWILSVVSVVCCQVEVSATDRSHVQRNPTE